MTLREMQLDIVKMMEDVDKLFSVHNVKYTLLGGSVLGAVRHKGFIPWDDDMDIGVMRKDFRRAEELLANLSPYIYESAEKHIVSDGPVGHLHLANEKYVIENSPTIDVFALDIVPEHKKAQKRLRFIANIHHLAVLRRPPRNRGKMKKIIIGFILYLTPNKLWDYIQEKTLGKIIHFCDRTKNTMIGNIWGAWTEKEYFEKGIYEALEKYQFENILLPIPKDYDFYLSQIYGNYMELPPLEERKPKHRTF